MSFQSSIAFIKSLYPGKDPIALHEPSFFGNEKKYVNDCIDSTFVSSVGAYVGRFEQSVADFIGQDAGAVAVVNGTAALHLALIAAGVKPGDRVITQPLSFIATANPIKYCGAEPVFVDVDEDTLGMSPKALRAYLTGRDVYKRLYGASGKSGVGGGRIAACIPMHTFGNPCRIDEIAAICEEFGITLIEDAAESIGSYYKGQHTGTFGDMGILSFNGNKTITTGGGGMIVTRHPSLVTQLKHLSTQAKIPHKWEFAHDAIGFNYRLPNVNAAMGVAQMETIEIRLQSKRKLAQIYAQYFASMGIRTISEISGAKSNFWLNGIFLENLKERNEFLQLAVDNHVHCRPAWNLLPTLEMYKNAHCEPIPVATRVGETLVNLPSSPLAT